MEQIKNFLLLPSKTGIMCLVLFFTVLFGVSDIFAEPAPYNKDWVLVSEKNWTKPNSAFQSLIYDNQKEEMVLRDSYDFTSSKSCVAIAVYNQENNSYHTFAITTKEGTNETPFKQGQAGWDNTPTLSNSGNGNFNMTNLFSDWYTVFPEWVNTDYWVTDIYNTQGTPEERWGLVQYDIMVTSASQLRAQLEDKDWSPPSPENTRDPYFYLKVTSPAIAQNIEYTITWETEGSFVDGHEGDYGIQVYLSQRNNNTGFGNMNFSQKDAIKNSDTYPFWLNQIAFTFTYGDLNKLIKWYQNASFLDNSFFIFLRIVDSNNQPVNSKWYSFHIVKKYEITSSQSYTEGEDGELSEPENLTSYEDGTMQYEDGRPTGDNSNGDGEQNSNGSSVSPSASDYGINNYDPTNPDQANFSYGGTINNLFQNLQELVGGISQIPTIMGTLLSFLPSWLLTLIAVSIGLFVVVGTIKLIVK